VTAKIYDLIIIGSSPLSLIEASYQADKGKTRYVVDKNECLAGRLSVFGTWK